jgi:hypothetical protein
VLVIVLIIKIIKTLVKLWVKSKEDYWSGLILKEKFALQQRSKVKKSGR